MDVPPPLHHMIIFFLGLMNDTILVLDESNEQRFTKLTGNFTSIQLEINEMETEFSDIWSKVVFFYDFEWLTQVSQITALQSLTGKLQGRITTQGDPCSHYREWVCSVQFSFVLVTFFPCFINIQIFALVPVMCAGNCQIILQGLKGFFNTL